MKKLPVFATVSEALKGAFAHFGTMVRLVWLPGLLYLGISIVVGWSDFASRFDYYDGEFRLKEIADTEISEWIGLINLGSFFLWPMIAIAWHRFVILGEDQGLYWRFKAREWKFLGASLFLVVPYLIVFAILSILFIGMGGSWADVAGLAEITRIEDAENPKFLANAIGMIFVGAFVAAYFAIRLLLLLPAVAIDQPFSPSAMLSATRGNFWRLLATFFLLGIVVVILYTAAGLTFFISPLVTIGVAPLIVIFAQITGVAVLSIAYRELVGIPERAGDAA